MREYKGFQVDDSFNIYNARTGMSLKPFIGTDGYYQVARRDENQHSYHIRVHVLFATLFIPNPNIFIFISFISYLI